MTEQHCARTDMETLLGEMLARQASDLHIVAGQPVCLRVHGELSLAAHQPPDAPHAAGMIASVLPAAVRGRLNAAKDFDCSVVLAAGRESHRFRANVFYAQGQLGACFRHIPERIPGFDWLGFPRGLAQRMIEPHSGLVIITGVTGSGKSTTLAALVNLLLESGGYRVITVEEPVEYLFPARQHSLVTQREVGVDVDSFLDGLKYGLRQDPDVVLLGEIRDPETAQMALTAAETGHLILTTLHTKDAKGAITRFVDLFPHDAQDDVRTQLGLSLRFVVAQHLLPSARPGEKRALALEVLVVNDPVRVGIKFGKIESIETAIQTGAKDGMIRLDANLQELARQGRITRDTARRFAKDPESLGV